MLLQPPWLPGVPLCHHSSRVAGRCAEPKSSAPTSRVVQAPEGTSFEAEAVWGVADLTSITRWWQLKHFLVSSLQIGR